MEKIYKMILVDDEDEIRGRISSIIDQGIGFEIVGSAGNGYDALELMEEHQVDVVLTDIKMPFIDGIELTRIIRRDYPTTKVAFITGYDEFHYAQEAISLRVDSYMMKPVTSGQINEFLTKLKISMDQELQQMRDIIIMKEKYESLLPVIGDSYLSSLIHMESLSDEDISKLSLYDINVEGHSNFQTCLIDINNSDHLSIAQLEQKKVNTNELAKKVFSNANFKHSLLVADGIVFTFSFNTFVKAKVDELLVELILAAKEYIGIDLQIGVSKKFSSFRSFPKSYTEALRSIKYVNTKYYGKIVYNDELYNAPVKQSLLTLSDYNAFNQVIQFGSSKDLIKMITDVSNRMSKDELLYIKEYLAIDLSSLIMHLAEQAQISLSDLVGFDLISYITKTGSNIDMIERAQELLLKIQEMDKRKQLSFSEQLTNQTISYIEEHYTESDLTLERLSETFNVSISHLSMIFKKYSGVTFSKYLIKKRIDKARTLLQNTDLKIADISDMVGYKDVYYFSHSFKRVTGISPREFRRK